MRRLLSLAVAIAALIFTPGAASARAQSGLSADTAQDRSVSYSYWTIEGTTVRVRFVLPNGEARDLAAPGAPPPTIAAVSTAVGGRPPETARRSIRAKAWARSTPWR
jgi:hypothetical protein